MSFHISGGLPLATWLRPILGVTTSTPMSPRKVSRGVFFPVAIFSKPLFKMSNLKKEVSEPMGGVERVQDLESKVLQMIELLDLGIITSSLFAWVSRFLEQGDTTVYFVGLRA